MTFCNERKGVPGRGHSPERGPEAGPQGTLRLGRRHVTGGQALCTWGSVPGGGSRRGGNLRAPLLAPLGPRTPAELPSITFPFPPSGPARCVLGTSLSASVSHPCDVIAVLPSKVW